MRKADPADCTKVWFGGSIVAQHDTASHDAFRAHHADVNTMAGTRFADDRGHAALDEIDVGDWNVRCFQHLRRSSWTASSDCASKSRSAIDSPARRRFRVRLDGGFMALLRREGQGGLLPRARS